LFHQIGIYETSGGQAKIPAHSTAGLKQGQLQRADWSLKPPYGEARLTLRENLTDQTEKTMEHLHLI
jgi:hypothetical protein